MYLNQITFPIVNPKGPILRGLCELSMIPIAPIVLSKNAFFSNRFWTNPTIPTEATVQEKYTALNVLREDRRRNGPPLIIVPTSLKITLINAIFA